VLDGETQARSIGCAGASCQNRKLMLRHVAYSAYDSAGKE